MTWQDGKNCALQVPPVVPYKELRNFPKALHRTTGGTCSAWFFHPVMDKNYAILEWPSPLSLEFTWLSVLRSKFRGCIMFSAGQLVFTGGQNSLNRTTDFYEFLPRKLSWEDLLIEVLNFWPPPMKYLVDHPLKFWVSFLGCKWDARLVSHEAMHWDNLVLSTELTM